MAQFFGRWPYGTPGGYERDLVLIDQVVIAGEGFGYQVFLTLTGPYTERNPAALSEIVRTATPAGVIALAITVQEDSSSVDTNVTVVDARTGIRAFAVSPGVVAIEIPAGGVVTALIADNAITTAKIQAAQITQAKMIGADGSGVALFARTHRDRVASGRVTVASTTGLITISQTLTLPNDGRRYLIAARGSCGVDKGTAGNINMQTGVSGTLTSGGAFDIASAYSGTSDATIGYPLGQTVITPAPGPLGAGQVVTGFIQMKVDAGSGFMHGAILEIEAIPNFYY